MPGISISKAGRKFILPGVVFATAALMLAAWAASGSGDARSKLPGPIDPQKVEDQDVMTWNEFHPLPASREIDLTRTPGKVFRLAVVGIDFPGRPFVMTLPKGSDPFGNPQVDPIARDKVPQFFADYFTKSMDVNHGLNIHRYWMEQSRGKFGVTKADAFGPYELPKPYWQYGLNEWGQRMATPDGTPANGFMEKDCDALWLKAVGRDVRKDYDAVLRMYAGYDETGVWQEFGEMKFNSKEDIPAEWGNPNPAKPRWAPTRYVEWTSWLAGSQQWGISSMRQGENSGTIPHELGHFSFNLPDLNNNPYVTPYRRAAVGTWDIMDRGCFNGPGGPHHRWVVPAVGGGAVPPYMMIRNRMACGFIQPGQLLELTRSGLAASGPVTADVTARAVDPLPGTYTGINVRLDGPKPGDLSTFSDPASDPFSPGKLDYNFYSLEVVQRIGYDSFCPDSGVLISKDKDKLWGDNGGPNKFDSYIWVIDAHPEDINMVDYIKPDGRKIMRTVADYRQLNDALFHAGTGSGSLCEWEDAANRLHFYVIGLHYDKDGILVYTLGVRSLDGAGPAVRGTALQGPAGLKAGDQAVKADLVLKNTGKPDASGKPVTDIYRLTLTVEGKGWEAVLPNALAAVEAGKSIPVAVYAACGPEAAKSAVLTVKAVSESDPNRTATVKIKLAR